MAPPDPKEKPPSGRPSPPEHKPRVIPDSLKAISDQLDQAGKAYEEALRGDDKELTASLKSKLQRLVYDSHKIGLEAAAADPDFPADLKARLDWSIQHAKEHESLAAEEKAKPHILAGQFRLYISIENGNDEHTFRNCGGWRVPHGWFTSAAVGDIEPRGSISISMDGTWLNGIQCTCYFMFDNQATYRWFSWGQPKNLDGDVDLAYGGDGGHGQMGGWVHNRNLVKFYVQS